MTEYVHQCFSCKRYFGGMACEAFAIIPDDVFNSLVIHDKHVTGDSGLTYIPIKGADFIPPDIKKPILKGKDHLLPKLHLASVLCRPPKS